MIFLNYRRDDSADATERLCDGLKREFGEEKVYLDVGAITGGETFPAHLRAALAQTTVLVVMIGPRWLQIDPETGKPRLGQDGDWVRAEIAHALPRPEVLVLPVLTAEAAMPEADDLPEDIQDVVMRNFIRLGRGPDYELSQARIFDSIWRHPGAHVPESASEVVKLRQLGPRKAWDAVCDKLDPELLSDYRELFPSAPEAIQARRWQAQLLEWQAVDRDSAQDVASFGAQNLFPALARAVDDELRRHAEAQEAARLARETHGFKLGLLEDVILAKLIDASDKAAAALPAGAVGEIPKGKRRACLEAMARARAPDDLNAVLALDRLRDRLQWTGKPSKKWYRKIADATLDARLSRLDYADTKDVTYFLHQVAQLPEGEQRDQAIETASERLFTMRWQDVDQYDETAVRAFSQWLWRYPSSQTRYRYTGYAGAALAPFRLQSDREDFPEFLSDDWGEIGFFAIGFVAIACAVFAVFGFFLFGEFRLGMGLILGGVLAAFAFMFCLRLVFYLLFSISAVFWRLRGMPREYTRASR